MKIAVFVSGRGSNLKALIKQQTHLGYQVSLVISNKATAGGLALATEQHIPHNHISWAAPEEAEAAALNLLNQADIELVVLAGFMKILSPGFITSTNRPIINIHPSLLPAYPGLNTHARVLAAGDQTHGASVHLVSDQLDSGWLIAQTVIDVLAEDDADTLSHRVLQKEHKLLPHVVGLFSKGMLTCDNGQVLMNQKPLSNPLLVD